MILVGYDGSQDAQAAIERAGKRGLTGLKSMLLGGVSHGVLRGAEVPVLVVPSNDLATARVGQQA